MSDKEDTFSPRWLVWLSPSLSLSLSRLECFQVSDNYEMYGLQKRPVVVTG